MSIQHLATLLSVSMSTMVQSMTHNMPCAQGTGLLACKGSSKCVQKTNICDGRADCPDEDDEDPSLCSTWHCGNGVRCEESPSCLPDPYSNICSGGDPRCGDKSDQAYCLHKIFTGCFANTSLGIEIMDCKSCFCELRNKTGKGQREGMFYKISGVNQARSVIMGRMCMERSSNLFCDGSDDCLFGEDEDPELCYKKTDHIQEQNKQSHVELDSFDIRDHADSGEEEYAQASFDITLFFVIFFISCACVTGICLVIIVVMFKLIKLNLKPRQDIPYNPSFSRQTSSESSNEYVSAPKSPLAPLKQRWTLKTTSIIKELGKGYYSKVYLAQDAKTGFVAIKTVDNQKAHNSEECISNEIEILSSVGAHLNIVRMIGCNRDEKLVVMEYCFNGNLKDYISRYRDYYMDEINPDTKELKQESFLYASPTGSEDIPMADFITSMHANIEWDTEEEKRKSKEVPVVTQSKSLIKTRRLLYWSYQISKGLKYLSDLSIIHRDIALRNMLLTNNDVVKIADFGLAVTVHASDAPGAMPQYWSKSNKPQPYKWMAIESLIANVYSQRSDVWSFGITMWEMFTLGGEPYGQISPHDLTQALNIGSRLEECSLAPHRINTLLRNCWQSDPYMRPSFDEVVLALSQYMSTRDKESYNARTRLDSGIAEGEGYVEMNQNTPRVSTPSTGTASKSSTRSRTISKCSELSYLPSSSSSQVPSPKATKAAYWANYKVVTGAESQVYSSIDQDLQSHYAVPQLFSITSGHPETRHYS